jgi:hypothetical protein
MLVAVTQTPGLTLAERVEALYVLTLGRKPRGAELARLLRHVEVGGSARQTERLADIFWLLLNTAEFRLNH